MSFKGLKVKELGENIEVLDKNLNEDFNPLEVEIKDEYKKEEGIFSALADFYNNLVICFKNEIPIAVFYVYDLEYISVSEKRGGSVLARGHETLHQYHFDDGEYVKKYTR